mmetsp:Transcript_36390/g.34414  ORF Transcript_36390/g.34414 Transcript_36390/m.34414 type:complete len:249 (-) Transcript_36390:129-875(-)|eukprot:CAMPEP_0119041684 /NCGR_PEP_ID=MMETSP1177-20130426/12960_1 /TAXON_ID=2985 /ORGANISM="Ochromonas sp, Strain CCMP1899" /LENGTH=248 /DNA_ID=CAMNT_0007007917 /DNA_START=113 /DNA_END=859 /DNA_ORIENTATION=+
MADECPVKHDKSSTSSTAAEMGCPVKDDGSTENYNPAANDLSYNQHRQPDQKLDMSTSRPVSGIPKSSFTPGHQFAGVDRWVYPSEQQYYNAMKRKGYNPDEGDMPVILAIHNIVNEQGWTKVKEWESLRGCEKPKLKQFLGRPKDISPKAYLLSLIGYSLPFDRHDWVVDRDGKDVRYVIDFYKGHAAQQGQVSIFLDVRPAIDSYQSVLDRVSVQFRSIWGKSPFPRVTATPANTPAPIPVVAKNT